MSSYFAKMNQRERVLMAIVGTVVFLILNIVLIGFFMNRHRALQATKTAAEQRLSSMQTLLAERDLWIQRDTWLSESHPKLTNEASSGVQLMDQIKSLARQHQVNVEPSPQFQPVRDGESYRSVPVTLEVTGLWPSMLSFLHSLQQPTAFIVIEDLKLRIDDTDKTKMRAALRVAKWYAPRK